MAAGTSCGTNGAASRGEKARGRTVKSSLLFARVSAPTPSFSGAPEIRWRRSHPYASRYRLRATVDRGSQIGHQVQVTSGSSVRYGVDTERRCNERRTRASTFHDLTLGGRPRPANVKVLLSLISS